MRASRTVYGMCALKSSSVVHCTAATGRRFHCVMVCGKKEYLYVSFVADVCLNACG